MLSFHCVESVPCFEQQPCFTIGQSRIDREYTKREANFQFACVESKHEL